MKTTDKIFWLQFIKDITKDTFDINEKEWLQTAIVSHCESYAKLTGRDPKEIKQAVDEFFNNMRMLKVLSIDAWGNKKDGYEWNNWFNVGEISLEDFEKLKTNKQIATWFKDNGFTTNDDMRQLVIEDDQYNKVICEKKTGMPLFAIEYGPVYN
jgi:hypothetical protein